MKINKTIVEVKGAREKLDVRFPLRGNSLILFCPNNQRISLQSFKIYKNLCELSSHAKFINRSKEYYSELLPKNDFIKAIFKFAVDCPISAQPATLILLSEGEQNIKLHPKRFVSCRERNSCFFLKPTSSMKIGSAMLWFVRKLRVMHHRIIIVAYVC